MQCAETDGSITLRTKPAGRNAYILLGAIEKFTCETHSEANFEWTTTIKGTVYTHSAESYLRRNGVYWTTNTYYSILTIESEPGNTVSRIECKIVHDDGQNITQCSLHVNIIIYGE